MSVPLRHQLRNLAVLKYFNDVVRLTQTKRYDWYKILYIPVASLSSISNSQSFSTYASAFPVIATSSSVLSRLTSFDISRQVEKSNLIHSSHLHKHSLFYNFFECDKYSKIFWAIHCFILKLSLFDCFSLIICNYIPS